jgi:predicted PurR-regulated permease PerM
MSVIRYDDAMSRTLFWVIAGGILLVGAMVVTPFVPAIMWAAVLSVLTYPYYQALLARKWKDIAAAGWVTLLTLLIIILPILGFGTIAFMEGSKALSARSSSANSQELSIQSIAAGVDKELERVLGGIPVPAVQDFRLEKFIRENQEDIRHAITGPATKGLEKFGLAVFSAIIALLTMFFMLKDGHKLTEPALHIIPLPREEAIQVLVRLRETVFSVFIGVVFVALIQGAVAGVAYAVAGVPGAAVWAAATFIFAMIPLVGPPVVFIPIALSLFLQGKVPQAVGLLLFGALVITQIDNILRPFFIGAKASLHPIAVFFSLLGGVLLMGPIGLMAGPLVLTLCIVVAEIIISRRRLMEADAQRARELEAPAEAEASS